MSTTFMELWARWVDLPGHGRQVAFGTLPQRDQDACWQALRQECDERNESERLELHLQPPTRHQPQQRSTAATSTHPGTVALQGDDPLKAVPPHVYFEAIAGIVVPPNGWVSCPMPDHEDLHPSCQVLSTHWRCFGCGRGGSIIDFAAGLYGIEPRGSGYWELRDRLIDELAYDARVSRGEGER